jgi:serine/threonine protein phosphatase 1
MSAPLSTIPGQPRTFAIGDIHGCATELSSLLKRLELQRQDTVVFLGDYIDRGPNSKGVIEQILHLKETRTCKVVCLKGNHEAMFVDFLESPESAGAGLFILNGGAATLASYAGPGGTFELPEEHLRFFYSLETSFETDSHFFVHAGVPVRALASLDHEKDQMTMLWGRQPFLSSPFKWEKIIVHGHTPVDSPEAHANRINVDTGCVYDGNLTAVELPSGRFHQVPKGVRGEAFNIPKDPGGQRMAVRYAGKLPVRAGFAGQASFDFETLNYNQFGILMKEVAMAPAPLFALNDVIEGQIGGNPELGIRFRGTVVRVEARGSVRLYGIKIERAINGDDGREWVRPEA